MTFSIRNWTEDSIRKVHICPDCQQVFTGDDSRRHCRMCEFQREADALLDFKQTIAVIIALSILVVTLWGIIASYIFRYS